MKRGRPEKHAMESSASTDQTFVSYAAAGRCSETWNDYCSAVSGRRRWTFVSYAAAGRCSDSPGMTTLSPSQVGGGGLSSPTQLQADVAPSQVGGGVVWSQSRQI
uniref:Uncharacterized protein n=1 Tax=Solanum lycopersicum TaxID=4081 RepID=A0A3Q7F6U6_SOLLC